MSPNKLPETTARTIIDIVDQVTIARYFAGIALTLCAYDWLILVERESQTVWKVRWTLTKAIYYINRVTTLVGLSITVAQSSDLWTEPLSLQFCKFYIWFVPMLQWASFCMGNTILALRIVALYHRHVLVKRLVYCLLVSNWLMTLVFLVHTLYLISPDVHYEPSLHLCGSNAQSPTVSGIFFGPTIFECIFFILTLYRAIQDIRDRVLTTNPNTPFLAILYRDGLYYFAAIFGIHIWNLLSYLTLPMTGIFMAVYFAWSVMTVMSGRVYVNLVLAAHGRGMGAETTTHPGSLQIVQNYRVDLDSAGRQWGHIETFGSKNRRHSIPLVELDNVS